MHAASFTRLAPVEWSIMAGLEKIATVCEIESVEDTWKVF